LAQIENVVDVPGFAVAAGVVRADQQRDRGNSRHPAHLRVRVQLLGDLQDLRCILEPGVASPERRGGLGVVRLGPHGLHVIPYMPAHPSRPRLGTSVSTSLSWPPPPHSMMTPHRLFSGSSVSASPGSGSLSLPASAFITSIGNPRSGRPT